MKNITNNLFQYFKVRYLIGTTQRYLAVMVLFSIATVVVTTFDRFKTNVGVLAVCTIGMLYYFMLYVKERCFYSKFKSYDYYEMKTSTGTIHMRVIDLYRRFTNKSNSDIKSLLIENSYNDFNEILKDYKELNSEKRSIQTHKTFIRPFMEALRNNGLVIYEDLDLENFFSEVIECGGIDIEEYVFPEIEGYHVQLKYIGCFQNKMLALRYPITKCSKKYFHKFSVSIPYFEAIVSKV